MNEIIINRNSKWQYVFSADLITVNKNNQLLHEIQFIDITRITYHPKFRISDIFAYSADRFYYFPKAFTIEQKSKKQRIISLKISNADFDKIKNIIKHPIEIV